MSGKRGAVHYEQIKLPRLVVFEGVDGSGKTTFSKALASYYREAAPSTLLYADSFPGSRPGTLGQWVYRFHHDQVPEAPSPSDIDPAALQLLHVAAHVDTITRRITPVLRAENGFVILDRFWWSTYAYARLDLSPNEAWDLVKAELPFWEGLPTPVIIYLSREISLKPHEIDEVRHAKLANFYQEVIAHEQHVGGHVIEILNEQSIEHVWRDVLSALKLPYQSLQR